MIYEVIKEIKNSCANNQMRDIFFDECETDDPEAWVRSREPDADEILREEIPGGVRFRVWKSGLPVVYDMTET